MKERKILNPTLKEYLIPIKGTIDYIERISISEDFSFNKYSGNFMKIASIHGLELGVFGSSLIKLLNYLGSH